jgi:hypothetical protein
VSKVKLALALGTLILLNGWAVPLAGAAHSFVQQRNPRSETRVNSVAALRPIRFRDDREAGLLINGWINGAGPFTFALDTGADISIVLSRIAQSAGLHITKAKRPIVAGLSNSRIASNEEALANDLAIGTRENLVPKRPLVAIVQSLPRGIDGILNPADLFGSLAYSIDLPNRQLLVFDSSTNGLDLTRAPKGGATVRWLRESNSDRPFVRLGDGRLALIDTGSGFGLAVNEAAIANGRNHSRRSVRDLGGGTVQSRQMEPTTISIGALVLRGIPTDLLAGVSSDTPLILGRRALYPFKITFDPLAQLIAIERALHDRY